MDRGKAELYCNLSIQDTNVVGLQPLQMYMTPKNKTILQSQYANQLRAVKPNGERCVLMQENICFGFTIDRSLLILKILFLTQTVHFAAM